MKIRETFLPDLGCIFVRIDLSQVEHRYCLMYTRSPRLIEMANLRPDVYDGHIDNARRIFNKQDISSKERYLGKTTTHAAERDMHGNTFSEHILKDTKGELFINPKQCQKMIDAFHAGLPEIRDSYFTWATERLIVDGILRNSWGRYVDLRELRITDDLKREVYSFYMQSENADHMAQYGMIPAFHFLKDTGYGHINVPVHDELIISSPPELAYTVATFLVSSLERPRMILGNQVVIPAGITLGKDWSDKKNEMKSLPDRKTFDEIAFAVYDEVKDEA